MYWPIAAPRIYAATKQGRDDEQQRASDDGATTPTQQKPTQQKKSLEKESDRDSALAEEAPPKGSREELPAQQKSEVAVEKEAARTNGTYLDEAEKDCGGQIVGIAIARTGHMFVTITKSTLTVWQTKPTVAVASSLRSRQSLTEYGPNTYVLLRPDSTIIVVQTANGFLVTYSLATDNNATIYRTTYPESSSGHARHKSFSGIPVQAGDDSHWGPGEGQRVREVSIQFRMVIKVDAGITRVLALDKELTVATIDPPAIQRIRWIPDEDGTQHSTELLKGMSWVVKDHYVSDMVHDRRMNISAWITSDGKAYAVQLTRLGKSSESTNRKSLFQGYGFHNPDSEELHATKAAINARFSLIAIGCAGGEIHVYTARDYAGHIPLSHKLTPPTSRSNHGKLNFLSYSPDGYCLLAGYEQGWTSWSVYGKPGACSFTADRSIATTNKEQWLLGVRDGFWIGGGSQLLLLGEQDNRLWILDMARSAVTGCFSAANVARSLLQTNSGFMIYRGYDYPDLTEIASENEFWNHIQVPPTYLAHQWPIRSAVISNDGRYVAVAGRRGLAHYSVTSGRWKTFEDPIAENEFTVRGGMCWHDHVLVAAVETNSTFEIRIYSRESALHPTNVMHAEALSAPIVLLTPSGNDSLLVYTHENILHHFIINYSNLMVRLVQVGKIELHGTIRSPPRVRALSWILPEDQLDTGDPHQDVFLATIVFLVDGKLVLLHPSLKENGEREFRMRVIAHNVEYYSLTRDMPALQPREEISTPPESPAGLAEVPLYYQNDLRDSLWYFDGVDMRVWTDVQDVVASASPELARELSASVSVPVDFYPLSVALDKGTLFGVESELVERRDTSFAFFRHATRTHLFLPPVLRHHIGQYNQPSALYLSHRYQHLDYFPHALEVLLHDVLDDEVDDPPPADQASLPNVLSFLSSFPQFLDIVVQCTRKTEVRSWETLFKHLPDPQELFERSLAEGNLKTAGGYLLVLHTLDETGSSSGQLVTLLRRAREEGDWELCKELARFLVALDASGKTLRTALEEVGVQSPHEGGSLASRISELSVTSGRGKNGIGLGIEDVSNHSSNDSAPSTKDYFDV
ncbi:Protein RIC1-like protein [Venturia nashicola]|uniref:Protein RIC1-like protein n=1 Tax=Venturia nashicola TaxID=86259 RepID=A0A4Z1PIM1_9PEZI|nr:Protein RIC1-like protein [Venturia nashicola]